MGGVGGGPPRADRQTDRRTDRPTSLPAARCQPRRSAGCAKHAWALPPPRAARARGARSRGGDGEGKKLSGGGGEATRRGAAVRGSTGCALLRGCVCVGVCVFYPLAVPSGGRGCCRRCPPAGGWLGFGLAGAGVGACRQQVKAGGSLQPPPAGGAAGVQAALAAVGARCPPAAPRVGGGCRPQALPRSGSPGLLLRVVAKPGRVKPDGLAG